MKTKNTKRIFAVLLTIVMLLSAASMGGFLGLDFSGVIGNIFSTFASAADIVEKTGSCGSNVNYTLYSDGNLVISGTGAMKGYSYTYYSPFYEKTNIKTVTIESGVTSIGSAAFYGCTGLTSITIPDSVTCIGDSAFRECTGLTSVTIGNSVTSIGQYAFYDCTGLTEINYNAEVSDLTFSSNVFYNAGTSGTGINVTFGDNVKKIPAYLFYINSSNDTPKITSLTIGNSVTSIGQYAFYDCTRLTEINYNAVEVSDLTNSNNVFYNAGTSDAGINVTFGNSVKKIPAYLFYINSSSYRPKITSLTIGNSVKSIGDSAFYGCTGITSVTIPDSIISIGNSAFYDCTGLKSVTIGNSVTTIGSYAFYSCNGFISIVIPDSVTSIGYYAFSGCTGLISVTIGNSVTSIGYCAFSGCTGLTSITIPNSVTSVDGYSFSGCTGLISVTIPDSVTSIGDSAFSGCAGLTSATIPDSITTIGSEAFYGCTGLTSVTIPDSVTSIGYCAFSGCIGLTSVTIGNNVTRIGDSAFANCIDLTEINYNAVAVSDLTSSNKVFYNAGVSGTGINVTFSDSVEKIPEYLFYTSNSSCCPKIISVTIPDSVKSIGDSAFYYCSGLTSVTIGNCVTSIGGSAFSYCTGLTSVTIPDSVTSIGNSAFYNCTGLTKINYNAVEVSDLTDSSRVFYNAGTSGTGINVTFSDSVEKIPEYLFYTSNSSYCPKIISITIGNNVASIGKDAFKNCPDIIQTNYLGSVEQWCNIDFGNEYSNPVYYSNNLYSNSKLVTSTEIPNNNTCIKNYTFINLKSLKQVSIPNSITSIGRKSFYGCSRITSINIPDNVTAIGDYAFYDCTDLTSVTIPDSVTSIGNCTFYGCTGLKGITIPYRVTSIGYYAFYNCTGLKSVTIPNSVINIGSDAFYYCRYLTKTNYTGTFEQWCNINFANEYSNPTYYSKNLYIKDTLYERVIIPQVVETVDSSCYKNLRCIKSVAIPKSVNTINKNVFSGCSGITDVYYEGTEEDWENIFVNEGNNYIVNATIHYNNYDTSHIHSCIVEEISPTCTEDGYYKEVCIYCGVTVINEVRPATGHIPVIDESVASSCTSTGLTEGSHCSVCGTVLVEQQAVPMVEHELGEYTTILEPTCTSKGVQICFCDNCRHYETKVIEAIGHTFGEWNVVSHATVQSLGYQERECSACGFKETQIIDKVIPPSLNMNTLSVDEENRLIYNLTPGLNSVDGFITTDNTDFEIVPVAKDSKFGTGSTVEIRKNNVTVDSYTIVVFGDINGDSYYDGMDALMVSCIANGMLTREQVGEDVWLAADCNHDGEIDNLDVEILKEAGILLAQIQQNDDMIETASLTEEYNNLICQTISEEVVADEPVKPAVEPSQPHSLIKLILEFIIDILSMMFSVKF